MGMNELENTKLKNIVNDLTSTISETTTIKFDMELERMIAENSSGITFFDLLSGEDDASIYQVLSAPDFKIYYPEPFIASPSFVHEEL